MLDLSQVNNDTIKHHLPWIFHCLCSIAWDCLSDEFPCFILFYFISLLRFHLCEEVDFRWCKNLDMTMRTSYSDLYLFYSPTFKRTLIRTKFSRDSIRYQRLHNTSVHLFVMPCGSKNVLSLLNGEPTGANLLKRAKADHIIHWSPIFARERKLRSLFQNISLFVDKFTSTGHSHKWMHCIIYFVWDNFNWVVLCLDMISLVKFHSLFDHSDKGVPLSVDKNINDRKLSGLFTNSW